MSKTSNKNAGFSSATGKRVASDEFDFDESEPIMPTSADKKRQKQEVQRYLTTIDAGVLFQQVGDDAFGDVKGNEPLNGARCGVLVNIGRTSGIPLRTAELNASNVFVPNDAPFPSSAKALNVFSHTCQDVFPKSVNGCTIAVPIAAHSPVIVATIRERFGDRIAININEDDINSTIYYVKKVSNNTERFFVPDLKSIYWLRETLEANNLLVLVKIKKQNDSDDKDRYALYLNSERFNTFKGICEYLRVRLALKA